MPFGLQVYRTSIQAQVTGLTPPLIEKLRAAFHEEYPSVRPLPIGILIYDEKAGRSILIGPEQTVVAQEGRPVQPDFAAHRERLQRLMEIFEWKEPVRIGFQFLGFLRVADARATSLEEFTSVSASTLRERLPEAVSAGLRFLVDLGAMRGELRLEPFEPEPHFLALNAEAATKEPVALADLPAHGQALLERLLTRWVPFLESTFTDGA